MTDFKFIFDERAQNHDMDIQIEIAHQLKRIADALEK